MASILIVAVTPLASCVTSEASRYEEKLTAVVKPNFQANDEVATAFGLRPIDDQPIAVTAVRDN